MAVDTQEKRMAAVGVARPWMRTQFPVATPDEQWRISAGNGYGGNALSAPTASVVPTAQPLTVDVIKSKNSVLTVSRATSS